VVEKDVQSFLPWKDVAVRCLPERINDIAKYDGAFPNGLPTPTKRPAPKEVDEIIDENCASWDNEFYVLAIGRGTKEGLPQECLSSLVAILEGGKVTTRWLCEAAMMSLARLYGGSQNAVISEIITDVWENHEISNVRDLALLALNIIGGKDNIMYCEAMKDIDKIDNKHPAWQFCDGAAAKYVQPPQGIDWAHFDDLLSGHRSMRARTFALLRLKNATTAELGSEWKQVFGNVIEIVLSNVVDDRLVLQAALAAVTAHAAQFDKDTRLKEDMLQQAQKIRQMCVFREGRKAAENVLKLFKDPFVTVFELFPGKPKEEKMNRQDLKDALSEKTAYMFMGLDGVDPMKVLKDEYNGDFALCWEEAILDATGKLSYAKTKVYTIIMLYYLVLNIDEMKPHHLQMLLASSNMFERYIGVVHIGIAGLIQHAGMVQNVVANESVSDVRGCAEVVAAKFEAKLGNKKSNAPSQGSGVPWGSVMGSERQALVRDLPEITGARSQDEVTKYLKGFGL